MTNSFFFKKQQVHKSTASFEIILTLISILFGSSICSATELVLIRVDLPKEEIYEIGKAASSNNVTLPASVELVPQGEHKVRIDGIKLNMGGFQDSSFLSALMLNPPFRILCLPKIGPDGYLNLDQDDDWMLAFLASPGAEIPSIVEIIRGNLLALNDNSAEKSIAKALRDFPSNMQISEERIPRITSTLLRLLTIQSLKFAEKNKIPVSDLVPELAKNTMLITDPKIAASIFALEHGDDLKGNFLGLLQKLESLQPDSPLRATVESQLKKIIVDTKSESEQLYFGMQLLKTDLFPIQKDFLRIASDKPAIGGYPIYLELLKSSDDMVAYHAARALARFKLPGPLDIPTAADFQLSPGAYRERWDKNVFDAERLREEGKWEPQLSEE